MREHFREWLKSFSPLYPIILLFLVILTMISILAFLFNLINRESLFNLINFILVLSLLMLSFILIKIYWIKFRWVLLITLIITLFILLNVFDPFERLTGPGKYIQVGPDEEYIPAKTLWDWMDVVFVPALVAFGVWWLNQNTQEHERRRAETKKTHDEKLASERNQETALQAYFDRMQEILLKDNLQDLSRNDKVRTVLRTHTLTILRNLNEKHKSAVVWFLIESELISIKRDVIDTEPIVSLNKADLSSIELPEANLYGTDLRNADLSETDLRRANLEKAKLHGANLRGTKLEEAIMPNGRLYDPNTPLSEQVIPKK